MIYVHLVGGLGNQLFQLAAALRLHKSVGFKIIIDIDSLKLFQTKRDFMLSDFLNPDIVEIGKIPFFYKLIIRSRVHKLFPFVFPWYVDSRNIKNVMTNDIYVLDDYFQDYEVVKPGIDDIRTFFYNALEKNKKLNKILKDLTTNTPKEKVLILHIRRGDYTNTNNLYPILDYHYYQKALSMFDSHAIKKVLIFSDEKILPFEFNDNIDVLKISDYRLNDWEEFIMMTQFENYIIANSTYSYWAAILSPSSVKKVVAPLKWVNSSENHKWNQNCALSYFSII